MDIELWLDVAGPAVIGAVALLDSFPQYRTLARALTGLPLVIAIVVAKALVIGVDLQASAPFAAAALMAPLVMFVAVGHLVARCGATSTLLVGWCVYGMSAFGLIKVARDLPPVVWGLACLVGIWRAHEHLAGLLLRVAKDPIRRDQPRTSKVVLVGSRMAAAYAIVYGVSIAKGFGPSVALVFCAFPSAASVGIFFNHKDNGAAETLRYVVGALKLTPSIVVTVLALCYMPSGWGAWAIATAAGFVTGACLMGYFKLKSR